MTVKLLCLSIVLATLGILWQGCANVETSNLYEESPNPYENETRQERDARMRWWREARFGMFIHWGVYSVPAGTYKDRNIDGIGEWIMYNGEIPVAEYKEYAKQFNPIKYNPDLWVRLAKEAGMKYIVITSKHHDGFALFDSKVTDWDVVDATPYGRDLLKPLAKACKKYGIKLGFYYSQAQDWCHPGGAAMEKKRWDPAQAGDMDEYIRTIAVPQVREILTNYGHIAVLWWDTPCDMNKERADMLLPLLKLQPGIITNNRLCEEVYRGDFRTPEQDIPATGLDYDWETCMTMNDTWGYKRNDSNWKPTKVLLFNLIDIASKGGNFLLNVGPKADGTIPEASIERLREIGVWMEVNGEAIYGTTNWDVFREGPTGVAFINTYEDEFEGFEEPKYAPEDILFTAKDNVIYAICLAWPDKQVTIKSLAKLEKSEIKSVTMLGIEDELEWSLNEKGMTIKVPEKKPCKYAFVFKIVR